MSNQLNVVTPAEGRFALLSEEFSFAGPSTGLNKLAGKRVMFRTDFSREPIPLDNLSSPAKGEFPSLKQLHSPRAFATNARERMVAGIDSSCALVGETDDGAIYAGRVATVYSRRGKILTYCRAGPVLFYLEPSNVYSRFCQSHDRRILNAVLLERTIAERFIRVYLERTAQIQVAGAFSEAMILVDGSLRPSALEPRQANLKAIELLCEQNSNQLLGFCKTSTLKFITRTAQALQSPECGSSFIDITRTIRSLFSSFRNTRVSVVKFSQNVPVFRVDFSEETLAGQEGEEAQVLSDLKFNDLFFRGYPETLRLAHHLSIFDSSAISSVRSYLSRKYGLVPVPSDDFRSTVLGRLV